eukprot:3207255-Amphidinium_carterae.3
MVSSSRARTLKTTPIQHLSCTKRLEVLHVSEPTSAMTGSSTYTYKRCCPKAATTGARPIHAVLSTL